MVARFKTLIAVDVEMEKDVYEKYLSDPGWKIVLEGKKICTFESVSSPIDVPAVFIPAGISNEKDSLDVLFEPVLKKAEENQKIPVSLEIMKITPHKSDFGDLDEN